ncbi:MAG: ribulose-phosphate 3-epimerase [bacterium]
MKNIIIAPSILSANFNNLEKDIKLVEKENLSWLHLDVMDGLFVPNISFGQPIIKSIRKISKLFFDVHLMITEPIRYIENFVDSGADLITIHIEACENVSATIKKIKKYQKKVGLALNPLTPLEKAIPYLKELDLLLLMSVNPGFGGQKFIESVFPKIKKARNLINQFNKNIELEVDGGIFKENICSVIEQEANILVMGSAIFAQPNISKTIKEIKKILKKGY